MESFKSIEQHEQDVYKIQKQVKEAKEKGLSVVLSRSSRDQSILLS